ncbi:Alpha/Beta hydrolase protein [Dactylonectria estremocensis]|uniref:Alpha/Beta hydrolase protein n=1 Tax=Dactylonectria estremocensis TaxID=1079267 RepID=A0A9P9IUY0_9HYPO|nr:Alpha/Beta hydrolase protein [Dactylonectria estremocensis]
MAPDKLIPNDPRVSYRTAELHTGTYKFMVGEPQGPPIATMILIHGFPDLGLGWRFQVPYFMSLGFRVVVPDMLGYGGTDRPDAFEEYTFKKVSADIKRLAEIVCGGKIILGGHDWGGAVVWRTALWYPDLIQGVFSLTFPYLPPNSTYVDLEDNIASDQLTYMGYQLQFRGPEVEGRTQGPEKVRQFLNAMLGGLDSNGEYGFSTAEGILFDTLPHLGRTQLLSEEELDYYTEQTLAHGSPELRGPLNWYRTRQVNFQDELPLAGKEHKFEMPALFISAKDDAALPPEMSLGMEKHFVNLTRAELNNSSHWILIHTPDEVNQRVAKWADKVLGGALNLPL